MSIVAHDLMNSVGRFKNSKSTDIIVMCSDDLPYLNMDIWLDGKESTFDDDLKVAWGVKKFESVRSLYTEKSKIFWDKYSFIGVIAAASGATFQFNPTAVELGIDSVHSDASCAIIDVALRHRYPVILALGEGIAIANTDIAGAIALLDLVMHDFGFSPVDEVDMYHVPEITAILGKAVVVGTGRGMIDAWSVFSFGTRHQLIGEQHNKLTLFTQRVIRICNDVDI